MPSTPFRSVFQQRFDVAVVGGGYAGYAAAMWLHRHGRRVLLIERRATLLHESGWGFAVDVGSSAAPEWAELMATLQSHHGASAERIDGAIAEVLAITTATSACLPTLYYVAPVAAWRDDDGRLGAVAVATKSGLRVVTAGAWIDATDEGVLLALLDAGWSAPVPSRRQSNLYFRHADWSDASDAEFELPDLPGAQLTWRPSLWPNERVLSINLPGEVCQHRLKWLPAVRAIRERSGGATAQSVITHASVEAVRLYDGSATLQAPALPDNVFTAVPALAGRPVMTLAQRFDLGLSAADQVAHAKPASGEPPFEFGHDIPPARHSWQAQVAIAGAGTGGAVAAIAAARQGANTLVIDPLPFPGGIGTGGGIHVYYHGVKGGLQEEIDQRIREIMPLFATVSQVRGFHPEAKKVVLEQMCQEAGATLHTDAMLFGVDVKDGRVTAAHVATAAGPAVLRADAWIDATGDGDLAAMAGAPYFLGRSRDGQLHAFSQSCGRCDATLGQIRMHITNFDAGFVDPTDPEDLTRGRLLGVGHYLQRRFTDELRPTYIAPAIGLRQGRQIRTRYMLTLADLIEHRTFPDAVGATGAHYDNHAVDYEFESDEAMFWVWACRQWDQRIACEISYRMLLPEELDNVWIACRAAGVTEEAHHSMRMQRDMQRLGEVAGIAAALAVRAGTGAPDVPYDRLRDALLASGALKLSRYEQDSFGSPSPLSELPPTQTLVDARINAWVEKVAADFGTEMYYLYRAGPRAAAAALRPLLESDDKDASWRAATIFAMWADPAAEPRLLRAIRDREYGFDNTPENKRPEQFARHLPNWFVAIAMLRICGTVAAIPVLYELSGDPSLLHNCRTTIAVTCERLAQRLDLDDSQRNALLQTLRRLLDAPTVASVGSPVRKPLIPDPIWVLADTDFQPVYEDFTWQLHYAVAKATQAAGGAVHEQARAYLTDPRAIVRKAFAKLLQQF